MTLVLTGSRLFTLAVYAADISSKSKYENICSHNTKCLH